MPIQGQITQVFTLFATDEPSVVKYVGTTTQPSNLMSAIKRSARNIPLKIADWAAEVKARDAEVVMAIVLATKDKDHALQRRDELILENDHTGELLNTYAVRE